MAPLVIPYELPPSSYTKPLAVVDVVFSPTYDGGNYQTKAVIDSGSEVTFVPFGEPDRHGWTTRGVTSVNVSNLGTKAQRSRRFLAKIRLYTELRTIPVCELVQDSSIQCALIGQDFLQFLKVELDGPGKELRIAF